jgi:hypothetical protein
VTEKFEFLGRQADSRAVGTDMARFKVDLQFRRREGVRTVFGRERGTPQRGPDAGQEFLDAKRLGDIVVSTCIKRGDLIFFRITHGQDDDWNIRSAAQRSAGFKSAYARHIQVEQYEVEHLARKFFKSLFSRARLNDLVTVPNQGGFHDAPYLRIVVHYQDLSCAHPRPLASGSRKYNCRETLTIQIRSPRGSTIPLAIASSTLVPWGIWNRPQRNSRRRAISRSARCQRRGP